MDNQIKKCVFEMFSDRNYNYNPNIDFKKDFYEIFDFDKKKYLLKFVLSDIKGSQIKEIIKIFLAELKEEIDNIEKIYVVIKSTFNYSFPKVEVLNSKFFKCNITKHSMSQPHELVNEHELERLTEKGIKNLPIIFESDPMVRWYGWKAGQICKITRATSNYFRLIINK